MKKLLLVTGVFCCTQLHAQWTTSGSNIYNANTGNVGINNSSPGAWLDIKTNNAPQLYLSTSRTFSTSRNWGIGTNWNAEGDFSILESPTYSTGPSMTRFLINVIGNVGIGITSPTEILDINGTARLRVIPQDNALTKLLVSDVNGKVWWRDVTSLPNVPYTITATSSIGVGTSALALNTGANNSAFGYQSLFSNTTGYSNIASGSKSLYYNTTGSLNIAIGDQSLYSNTVASGNIAIGDQSLRYNTTGGGNIAVGSQSLISNTTGAYNIAIGSGVLFSNTTGYENISLGTGSLNVNTTGHSNTGIGIASLYQNGTGFGNTAIGKVSLYHNTTGSYNTGNGYQSLFFNESGDYNTAIGYNAGPASYNYNLSNTTSIGNAAVPTASNQVRIGNGSVTSIGGQVSWSTLSDGRFKTDVKEDVSGLDFINKLRPVSYSIDKDKLDSFLGIPDSTRYRGAAGRTAPARQTGFVAQEVEEVIKKTGYVFHGVEAPQNDRDHYGIRYAEFVVPLVKAVQELSAKVEKQQKIIDALKNSINEKDSKELNSLDELELFQNHPNPFQQDTEITMTIPASIQSAVLFIYDLSGKQIDKRPIGERGQVIVKLEGGHLAPGMYIYTLVADNRALESKRMLLTE